MSATLIALAATGLGLQMKGQYEAGKAAERQAKSEAERAEYEAKLREREAEEQQAAAAHEERKLRKAGVRAKRRRITQAGQAGILPIGSFELGQEELASEIETDALRIRRGGMTGYQESMAQANISRGLGRSALLRGRSKRRASYYRMAGTGLRGAVGLAGMYGSGGGSKSFRYTTPPKGTSMWR